MGKRSVSPRRGLCLTPNSIAPQASLSTSISISAETENFSSLKDTAKRVRRKVAGRGTRPAKRPHVSGARRAVLRLGGKKANRSIST